MLLHLPRLRGEVGREARREGRGGLNVSPTPTLPRKRSREHAAVLEIDT